MYKIIKRARQIPVWVFMVIIFGGLYLTGLHTEVIGQVQRIILATGLMKPEVNPLKERVTSSDENTSTVYNFSLRTLRGKEVSMESLKGKVVFMNFWATWCPPCIAEMPNIHRLYEKVKSDKIAFVMVSLDQNPAKAQKFISRKGFTFPVYTPNGPLPSIYEGQVIPTTFIISPDGHIVSRKDGMADYDNEEFREYLQNLAQSGEGLSPSKASMAKPINSQGAKVVLAQQPSTLILDVRTAQEFADGHLEKALNLDYNASDFQSQLSRLDKTKPYLVYCAVGGRSRKAAKLMQEMGFHQVYNVTDGFPALKSLGLPVSL
jgi:rhodanese-related sulfurtransferase/thiol-disulfide isomerase/thioredoxin